MFLHEHMHSVALDLALLCTGGFFGMFLGYILGTLHSDKSRKHSPVIDFTEWLDATERPQASRRYSDDLRSPA
jgi:hypothetical protein